MQNARYHESVVPVSVVRFRRGADDDVGGVQHDDATRDGSHHVGSPDASVRVRGGDLGGTAHD